MDYKSNRLLDIMASGLDGAELEDAIYGEIALLPSEMDKRFVEIYKQNGSKAATEWLYNYCVNNMYIKKDVLDKNPRFDTSNGLTITINKAKPEFRNPQKAKASNSVEVGFAKCVICRENEGFSLRNNKSSYRFHNTRWQAVVLTILALRIFPRTRYSCKLRAYTYAYRQGNHRKPFGFQISSHTTL